jgi:putative effector of murein hydrolase
MLNAMRIREPAARGLAAGCAAHGGGLVAVTPEGAPLPFAVVGRVLTGACSLVLLCLPRFGPWLMAITTPP